LRSRRINLKILTVHARAYQEALSRTAIVLPFDVKAATHYARLRCDRSIHAADAIQLARAGAAGVDLFIANDERLQTKRVDGIQFVTWLKAAPL